MPKSLYFGRYSPKFITHSIFEGTCEFMEETKFAKLDQTQLEKINELEKQIGFTLVAYDTTAMPPQGSEAYETNSNNQNHPS